MLKWRMHATRSAVSRGVEEAYVHYASVSIKENRRLLHEWMVANVEDRRCFRMWTLRRQVDHQGLVRRWIRIGY